VPTTASLERAGTRADTGGVGMALLVPGNPAKMSEEATSDCIVYADGGACADDASCGQLSTNCARLKNRLKSHLQE
jgi:hypothetical protein